MSEISKPDYTYLWSSGGSMVAPTNTKIQTGWISEVPPFQWENWVQNRQDQAISHILQKGISVWSASGEYYFTSSGERSYVQGSDGQIYVAVADSVGQNPVTDSTSTYWKLAFNNANPLTSSTLNLKITVPVASASVTVACDEIITGISLGGTTYKVSNFSKLLNIATTGLGGMDTGTAPINGYIAIYAIYNPFANLSGVLAVNSTSTAAPVVYGGVNAPSGYTSSALLTVIPTNALGQLKPCAVRGKSVSLPLTLVFSFSANIPAQNISLSASVPLNAIEISGEMSGNSSVSTSVSMNIYSDVASTLGQQNISSMLPTGGTAHIGNYSNVPLVTPQSVGIAAVASSGTPSFNYYITGYKL